MSALGCMKLITMTIIDGIFDSDLWEWLMLYFNRLQKYCNVKQRKGKNLHAAQWVFCYLKYFTVPFNRATLQIDKLFIF